MSGFSFDQTVGASQSTAVAPLKAGEIHEVEFKGFEARDTNGYKMLIVKFEKGLEGKDGRFQKTFFEPKEADFQRREYSGRNGVVQFPSNSEKMMLTLKHIIDGVYPELGMAIDSGEQKLNFGSWEELRKAMVKIGEQKMGAKTKLKLMNNYKGEPDFPERAISVSKEGKAYIGSNFIGDRLFFSTYEQQENAKAPKSVAPKTNTASNFSFGGDSAGDAGVASAPINFNL